MVTMIGSGKIEPWKNSSRCDDNLETGVTYEYNITVPIVLHTLLHEISTDKKVSSTKDQPYVRISSLLAKKSNAVTD